MKLGIIGANGFVGTAMQKLFPTALPFDIGASQSEINACAAVFVCVPTNGLPNGMLDMSIVEDVVSKCTCPLIIIRSTLNPGTADYLETLYGRNICVVPEYIGETVAHPLLDEASRPFLVIGGREENRRKAIEIFMTCYNANIDIRQVSNLTAEAIKLAENRAIGWAVMQSHELYQTCEAAGLDYYEIRQIVYGCDPRFRLFFTFAYPGNLGFHSSRCLRKDIPAFVAWAHSVGYDPVLTQRLIERSNEYAIQR